MSGNTLKAVSALVDTIGVIAEMTAQLQSASQVIQRAQTEGRDISDSEWDKLSANMTDSRTSLEDAINNT